MDDLIKLMLPLLQDVKTVGATTFAVGCLVLLFVARHLSKKTTEDFQAAAKRIENEPQPVLSATHTIATLKLELETMRVRMERAEWAAKEWQLQHVKTQAELNQTAAELSTTREELERHQLEADQRAERQLVSDTTEKVRLSKALPVPAKALPPALPRKKPRQNT